MEQTLIFSGLKHFPGKRFWKKAMAVFICFGSPCSHYILPLGITYSGDPGPDSAERLFPLKPKNPI